MKKASLLLFLTILFFACKSSKSYTLFPKKNTPTPPGTIKIADNLYFDKLEITNFSYLEFMFWTKSVYGKNSIEFTTILPDTNVWNKLNIGYISLDTFYLRHPTYRDYPVVGVSYEQASNFSKWRSDRVMEYHLIKNKIIPNRTNALKDSVFTIEKYYTGNYCGIQPNPNFLIYPCYSLPDSITYKKAALFADSLNSKNYKFCRMKYCEKELLIDFNCSERNNYQNYTLQTTCGYCPKEIITHLKGNVREMTNKKGIFYGGSFIDSCTTNYNSSRQDTLLVNCYTGFRNTCEFKQW
jgi:hypothetical protein